MFIFRKSELYVTLDMLDNIVISLDVAHSIFNCELELVFNSRLFRILTIDLVVDIFILEFL